LAKLISRRQTAHSAALCTAGGNGAALAAPVLLCAPAKDGINAASHTSDVIAAPCWLEALARVLT
jgi:hypothetical protein